MQKMVSRVNSTTPHHTARKGLELACHPVMFSSLITVQVLTMKQMTTITVWRTSSQN